MNRLLWQEKCPQALAFRVQIILHVATGMTNAAIARALGTTRATVRKWRQRLHATAAKREIAE